MGGLQLCDNGEIDARYRNGRRPVRLDSVRAYADSLPTERPNDV